MVIFTTCFIIFLTLLLPGLLSLGMKFIPFGVQPSLDGVENIHGYQVISQKFTSLQENLTGIALSLKNPYSRNRKDILLEVYDGGEIPIRVVSLNGSHIEDGQYVKFIFEPITNSKEKEFTYILAAPQTNQDESLQVFYTQNIPFWAEELRVGKEIVPNFSISFVSLYKPINIFDPAVDIYLEWMGRLVKDGPFFVLYLTVIGSLGGYLITSNFRGRRV